MKAYSTPTTLLIFFLSTSLVFSQQDQDLPLSDPPVAPPIDISMPDEGDDDEANFLVEQLIGPPEARGEGGRLNEALKTLDALNKDDASNFGRKKVVEAIAKKKFAFILQERKQRLDELDAIEVKLRSIPLLEDPCERYFTAATYHGQILEKQKSISDEMKKIAVGNNSLSVKETDWGKSVIELESLFGHLEKICDRSSHPFIDVALNRYRDVVASHISELGRFEQDLGSLAAPVIQNYSEVMNGVIDSLFSSASTTQNFDEKVCATRQLLRIALYQKSEFATSKFVEFASSEILAGPEFASVVAIRESAFLNLKPGTDQNPANIEEFVGVAGVIEKIISIRGETAIRSKLVEYFHCDLILGGFNQLREDESKEKETLKVFNHLNTALNAIGSIVGLTEKIQTAAREMTRIYHVGPFEKQDEPSGE